MTKMTVLYAVFVAILFVVLVRRHTRVEEENGQAELVGGTAVGRDAPLAAAVAESVLVVVLGALVAAGNVAGGLPVAGSVLFGASWFGIGVVAAGITGGARAAVRERPHLRVVRRRHDRRALPAARGRRHTSAGWLRWLSPFGLEHPAAGVGDPRWWLLLPYVALAGALAASPRACAAAVTSVRAWWPRGPGRPRAHPGCPTRSLRPWCTGGSWRCGVSVAVLGVLFGFIAPSIDDLLDSEAGRQVIESLGGSGMQDAPVAAVLVDRRRGRHLLRDRRHRARRRRRARRPHRAGAGDGGVPLAIVPRDGDGRARRRHLAAPRLRRRDRPGSRPPGAGAGTRWRASSAPRSGSRRPSGLSAALALLLYAAGSRYAVAGWAVLAGFFALGQLGEVLELPGPVTGLSPYTHLPAMPVEPFAPATALTLTAIAAATLGAAWWRFRERDIR